MMLNIIFVPLQGGHMHLCETTSSSANVLLRTKFTIIAYKQQSPTLSRVYSENQILTMKFEDENFAKLLRFIVFTHNVGKTFVVLVK